MVAVIETSWQDILDGKPFPESPARKAFREAVEAVAEKARTALPESNGRIDKAVHLILNGDISIDAKGEGTVASQSNGTGAYNVGKGFSCPCKDHPKSPRGLCKHLLCYHIFTRSTALAKQRLAEVDAASNGTTTPAPEQVDEAPVTVPPQDPVAIPATPALPEAPASVNFHTTIAGRQIQITLRDTDETRLLARLEMLLQRFPVVEEPKEPAQQEGWCAEHNAKMKLHHGKKGTWWSHKLPNGQWCNRK